jgi:hypothetical protein
VPWAGKCGRRDGRECIDTRCVERGKPSRPAQQVYQETAVPSSRPAGAEHDIRARVGEHVGHSEAVALDSQARALRWGVHALGLLSPEAEDGGLEESGEVDRLDGVEPRREPVIERILVGRVGGVSTKSPFWPGGSTLRASPPKSGALAACDRCDIGATRSSRATRIVTRSWAGVRVRDIGRLLFR